MSSVLIRFVVSDGVRCRREAAKGCPPPSGNEWLNPKIQSRTTTSNGRAATIKRREVAKDCPPPSGNEWLNPKIQSRTTTSNGRAATIKQHQTPRSGPPSCNTSVPAMASSFGFTCLSRYSPGWLPSCSPGPWSSRPTASSSSSSGYLGVACSMHNMSSRMSATPPSTPICSRPAAFIGIVGVSKTSYTDTYTSSLQPLPGYGKRIWGIRRSFFDGLVATGGLFGHFIQAIPRRNKPNVKNFSTKSLKSPSPSYLCAALTHS
jgi:hypothetical protein